MSGNGTTVVFVHGMYMNAASWQPWADRFAAAGLDSVVPSWPYHEGEPAHLREQIDPALGKLKFGDVVQHYKTIIDGLPERPLLVGHSIGGLAVQKLVNDGYAKAAVSISTAPARGIVSFDPHFFRANFPHINPFAGHAPVQMTPKRFHYTFCNTMTREESDAAFAEYVVPESRNVPRSTLTKAGAIDFRREHVPMLFIAGETDHLTPLSGVKRNASAYDKGPGQVRFQRFAGRSHFICNAPGWEEVADASLEFFDSVAAK
jgi:pimeloyl-ACP methyl ester carboxylesterase